MPKDIQKIAILGAGAMGLTAAYALSQRGYSVAIYDPEGFPHTKSASHIAGGMLAPYAEIEHMDETWIEAGLESIEIWRAFSLNHDTGFAQNGSLLIAHKEDRYIWERFKAYLPQTAQEIIVPKKLEQELPEKFSCGLFLSQEAHLTPALAIPSLCGACKTNGVKMVDEAASPESLTNDFDYVIDARGMAMNDAELRGVKGETLVVRNKEFNLSRPVRLMHPRYPLYIVPRGNGIFMIGATQIESEGEHMSVRSGLELMSALYSLHPSFGEAEILETNVGLRPSYPDNLPRLTIEENIIRAGGLFRHGFLLSPVMAECIADYVAGRAHKFMYLFERYKDENHSKRTAA